MRKKIEYVSLEKYKKDMADVTEIFNGMTVASNQQAQMLASIANQLSIIAKSLRPKEVKKVETDVSVQ